MKAPLQTPLSLFCQCHVVAGNLDTLKSTAALELGQRIAAPKEVHQMAKTALRANLNRFCNQSIVGCLIAMLQARDDLPYEPEAPGVAQHHKADHFVSVVRADHVLSRNVASELLLNSIEILAVMPKASPLTHPRFIEDCCHATDKIVVIGCFPYHDTFLFRLADQISHARLDLPVPPVLIAVDRQHGDFLPLDVVRISRRHI